MRICSKTDFKKTGSEANLSITYLYVNLSLKVLQKNYRDHVKPTIGKQKLPKKERRKKTIEDLNDLVMKGKINKEIYLTIRTDMVSKRTDPDTIQGYV